MTAHTEQRDVFALQVVASTPGFPLAERIAAARQTIELRSALGLPLETCPTWVRDGVRYASTQRPWHALLERLESFGQ